MAVVSIEFFVLLAVTVTLLAVVPPAARRTVLLAASLLFYFGSGTLSALLGLGIVAANFGFLRALVQTASEPRRDRLFGGSIVFNLTTFVALKLGLEATAAPLAGWSLAGFNFDYPLGLSFVILMLHAAVCDAYVRRYVPAARPGTFILYGTFFPYLTAGPVERLNHMEAQLDRPAGPTVDDLRAGAALIALGLVKKLVVANRLQPYIDAVFSGEQTHSAPTVAFAVALNAVHLYADFSGYTDIARGAARCLGIDVRINFDRPFSSRSVTEFWRRWHISFSSWLRDYLYMPLAYSLGRVSRAGPVAAILITFLACGFWHRAAWTFVLFGALHGVALAAELRFGRAIARAAARWPEHLVALASRGYTLVFVALTIVLIPAVSVAEAGAIVSRIVSSPVLPVPREAFGYLGPFLFLLMLAAIALWQALERWHERLSLRTLPWFLLTAALAVLFLGSTGPGFVYEQF